MAIVLFDTNKRERLFPLTYTKAVADLFFGLFTIKQRWQLLTGEEIYVETADYLQVLYPILPAGIHTWISASVLNFPDMIEKIKAMKQGDVFEDENGIIACKGNGKNVADVLKHAAMNFTTVTDAEWLFYPHQLLKKNDSFIRSDFALQTKNKTAMPLSGSNQCINKENIFVAEEASVSCSIINAESGPVYIGKNAVVMEGSLLRGPLSIGENAIVKMGCKLYGATSVGAYCTVGGEIKNSILQACSNKAHDGYLGDSLIGAWCNLGAGATNSNVKNTAGDVMLWNEYEKAFINAGNKCGVITGDYTKVAINSSINTGSVYGVSCNVFGEGLLPTQLRNFAWGASGEGYTIDKAIKHIRQWMNFKQQTLSGEEESVLTYIFDNFIDS